MSILLLGKDGQVGWQLQRSLALYGPLVACGRAECDLSDPDQIRSVIRAVKPSVIVNAAAMASVDGAESAPELAWRINAEAPGILAEEAVRREALLVHYSCDQVFDGDKLTPYCETDPAFPVNIYGQSKLAGEVAIRAVGGKSLVFRTGWVFGARGESFVKDILRLAREREQINVVDDQIGSPTPAAMVATVTGVVLAMLCCGQRLEKGENRLYHLAAARPVSWHEFARTIVALAEQTSGFNLRLKSEAIHAVASSQWPTPARRPVNSRLDCRRLEADFGLQMPDWQAYLVRMLQLLALKQNGY